MPITTVNDTCTAYRAMEADWRLCQALMGGTDAMRAAGETYLPKFASESADNYLVRLKRTVLTNYFRKTLEAMAGKPFAKPIVLGQDVPEAIAGKRGKEAQTGPGGWVENIDLCGNHLDVFARQVFTAAMRDGLTHILVDSTGQGAAKTVAEEKAAGVRPYFVHVLAQNLIGWRWVFQGGRAVLVQARIREVITEPDGEFGEKPMTRVRVLAPGAYRLYEENDKKEWLLAEEGGTSLPYIPLVTVYGERTGFMTGRSPLLDLAHLNVAHWQSSSDQRNILTHSRFAMLAASGYNKEQDGEVVVGPNRVLTSTDPNGKWYYVEPTGAAIAAGRQDLEDLKTEMAMNGLTMLLPRTGDQTATGRVLDYSEANSPLQAMALGLGDALEQALQIMADWAGLPGGGSVTINANFGLSLQHAQDVSNLVALRAAGEISQVTLWAEMKRRGVLADDFDPETEAQRLNDERPPLGGASMDLTA